MTLGLNSCKKKTNIAVEIVGTWVLYQTKYDNYTHIQTVDEKTTYTFESNGEQTGTLKIFTASTQDTQTATYEILYDGNQITFNSGIGTSTAQVNMSVGLLKIVNYDNYYIESIYVRE